MASNNNKRVRKKIISKRERRKNKESLRMVDVERWMFVSMMFDTWWIHKYITHHHTQKTRIQHNNIEHHKHHKGRRRLKRKKQQDMRVNALYFIFTIYTMKICIPYIIYTLSYYVITQRLISCLIYTCRTARKSSLLRYLYIRYIH